MDFDVVNAGVDVVNDVLEHHREVEAAAREERGVSGDVLSNLPEDSFFCRLGRAGAEELHAAKPQADYPVVLLAFAFGAKLEAYVGPGRWAIGRRGVAGGEGRAIHGVGEGVPKDSVGAGWGQLIER